jgi:hypothetical protein
LGFIQVPPDSLEQLSFGDIPTVSRRNVRVLCRIFFFWQNSPLGDKKMGAVNATKAFCSKMVESHCILGGGESRNCQIETIVSSMSPEYSGVPQKNLLSSMTCSQIRLSPLVHDCQSTYLTKLKRKTLVQCSLRSIGAKAPDKNPTYLLSVSSCYQGLVDP